MNSDRSQVSRSVLFVIGVAVLLSLWLSPLAQLPARAQKAAAPTVSAVRPEHLKASQSEQTLALVGTGFLPGMAVSVVDPAGSVQDVPAGAITNIKPTSAELTVTLELTGDYSVVVTNPAGTPSNSFGFHVGPR